MSYKWQIGQFFLYIGLIALILFFITAQVGEPYFLVFCSGLLVMIFGGYVMWIGRNPVQPSGRFRTLRRLSERKQDEEKEQKKE